MENVSNMANIFHTVRESVYAFTLTTTGGRKNPR